MQLMKHLNLILLKQKILQSRILSIYTHFYLTDGKAEENFLKSYAVAKTAIEIDPKNDNAYVEAAHSLGRYGQKIGIMSAITKGIADRVKKYLDKALEINSNNIFSQFIQRNMARRNN